MVRPGLLTEVQLCMRQPGSGVVLDHYISSVRYECEAFYSEIFWNIKTDKQNFSHLITVLNICSSPLIPQRPTPLLRAMQRYEWIYKQSCILCSFHKLSSKNRIYFFKTNPESISWDTSSELFSVWKILYHEYFHNVFSILCKLCWLH